MDTGVELGILETCTGINYFSRTVYINTFPRTLLQQDIIDPTEIQVTVYRNTGVFLSVVLFFFSGAFLSTSISILNRSVFGVLRTLEGFDFLRFCFRGDLGSLTHTGTVVELKHETGGPEIRFFKDPLKNSVLRNTSKQFCRDPLIIGG